MEPAVVAAVASIMCSLITLTGVIITTVVSNSKTLYRIEQLEKKQDKHNGVIERTYHLEKAFDVMDERQHVANHRIDDLERKVEARTNA